MSTGTAVYPPIDFVCGKTTLVGLWYNLPGLIGILLNIKIVSQLYSYIAYFSLNIINGGTGIQFFAE